MLDKLSENKLELTKKEVDLQIKQNLDNVLNKNKQVLSISWANNTSINRTIIFLGKKYYDLWVIDFITSKISLTHDPMQQVVNVISLANKNGIENINSDWGSSYVIDKIIKDELKNTLNTICKHNQIMYTTRKKHIEKHIDGHHIVNRNYYIQQLVDRIKNKTIILPGIVPMINSLNDLTAYTDEDGLLKFDWSKKKEEDIIGTNDIILALTNILVQDDIDRLEAERKNIKLSIIR